MSFLIHLRAVGAVVLALLSVDAAIAHGARVGDIAIAHPFATPTPAGASSGAAYIVELKNTGGTPDRLLRATSPMARQVELHSMTVDAGGVMRMRELSDIALAPGVPVRMQPGAGLHIMLMGLARPLVEGDRFPMTLEFERAGKAEVDVVVQRPPSGSGEAHAHPR